jgi:predicted nucleic acid-binding protein
MTDLEDSHVLDTAISSRSHFLVTDNFRHFLEHKDVKLIEEKQLAVYQLSDSHEVYIIKPDLLGQYLSRLDSTRLNAINRSFD